MGEGGRLGLLFLHDRWKASSPVHMHESQDIIVLIRLQIWAYGELLRLGRRAELKLKRRQDI